MNFSFNLRTQNDLCNLRDITELPPENAVIKVLWTSRVEEELSSISSLDKASVSLASSPSASSIVLKQWENAEQWPSPFPIPTFSYDVELFLAKGNDVYDKSKTLLTVPIDMRMDILDKISQVAFSYMAYPKSREIESVAVALIQKYPCL